MQRITWYLCNIIFTIIYMLSLLYNHQPYLNPPLNINNIWKNEKRKNWFYHLRQHSPFCLVFLFLHRLTLRIQTRRQNCSRKEEVGFYRPGEADSPSRKHTAPAGSYSRVWLAGDTVSMKRTSPSSFTQTEADWSYFLYAEKNYGYWAVRQSASWQGRLMCVELWDSTELPGLSLWHRNI